MDLKIKGVKRSPWNQQELSSTQLQRDSLEQQRKRIREIIQQRKDFLSPTLNNPGRTGMLLKNKKLGRKLVPKNIENNNLPPILKGKNTAKSSDTDGKLEARNTAKITDKKLDKNQYSIEKVTQPRRLLPVSVANVCDLNEINLEIRCKRQPARSLKQFVDGHKPTCGNENAKQQQQLSEIKGIGESVSNYDEVNNQQKRSTKTVRFAEGTNFNNERERNCSAQKNILPSMVRRSGRLWLHRRRQEFRNKHSLEQSDKSAEA